MLVQCTPILEFFRPRCLHLSHPHRFIYATLVLCHRKNLNERCVFVSDFIYLTCMKGWSLMWAFRERTWLNGGKGRAGRGWNTLFAMLKWREKQMHILNAVNWNETQTNLETMRSDPNYWMHNLIYTLVPNILSQIGSFVTSTDFKGI